MRLYFIRHAQSADNQYVVDNADKGIRGSGLDQSWLNRQADPELSETGRKQIGQLNRFIKAQSDARSESSHIANPYREDYSLTHVYSSLMVRTMETALAMAQALGVSPAVWMDLHETGGIWEPDPVTEKPVGSAGRNRAYFEERFPEFVLPDGLNNEGWWNRPLETGAECKIRAQRFVDNLLERHGDTTDKVGVVSHGLFYIFFIKAVLKIPSGTGVSFAMNNAAITRIDFNGDRASIIFHNRTDHFPPEIIT